MALSHTLRKSAAVIAGIALYATTVEAGETAAYLKSGWFTWEERLHDDTFVKENGFLHALGVTRKDDLYQLVSLSELLEVWGGNVDYDGHDVTGTFDISTDTSYIGTREEVSAGVPVALGHSALLKPFAAVGHKFWVRTRSSEDWNIFFAKGGLEVELQEGALRFFARGGVLAPFYARNHVDLGEAGYEDVVVYPESRVSSFAEGGVTLGAFVVSIEYEELRFSESPKVVTRKLNSGQTGAAVVNNQAFQPASTSSLVSLKVSYRF